MFGTIFSVWLVPKFNLRQIKVLDDVYLDLSIISSYILRSYLYKNKAT